MNNKVWTGDIGKLFEKAAIMLLRDDGYTLLEHSSEIKPSSPYDLIMSKDGNEFLVEIRGRRAFNNSYFSFGKNKIERLKSFDTRCIVVFINYEGYNILNLSDLDVDEQSVLINGIKIALTNPKNIKKVDNICFRELFRPNMNKHKDHKKKRLYARDTLSGAKQWQRTDLYLCECDAVLESNFDDVKVRSEQ